MVDQPLITVVIPVKNGDAWLDSTLSAIYQQTLASSMEVLVIDSGSTDRTFEILNRYPVRVLQIDAASFNHGTVRNLGAAHARGKYIAMTVQDAEPADKNWLQQLLNGFDDDTVAGVCGLQIVPHDHDKNPVDWFRPLSEPAIRKYRFEDASAFDKLTASEAQHVCSWDNVNAMYRRDILIQVPFQQVSFAEDAVWARDALRNGYSIVYNPAARVKHYHFETPGFTFRRNLTVHYHFYRLFGTVPADRSNELMSILRNIKLLLEEKQINWADKWKWLVFNYRQRRAAAKATEVFNKALAQGEEALESVHDRYCGKSPQALKPAAAIKSADLQWL